MEKKDMFSHMSIKVDHDQDDQSMFKLKKRNTLLNYVLKKIFNDNSFS